MSKTYLLVGCAVVLGSAGWMFGDTTPKKNSVKKVMIATHKGDDSPLERVSLGLRKENPDWEELVEGTKAFTAMADVLGKRYTKDTYTREYIISAKRFRAAVRERDRVASKKAFLRLESSCCDCHGYGRRISQGAMPDNPVR